MSRVTFALVIVGAVLCYVGYQEWVLSGVAKAEAQEISCADLIANGVGDNAHVKVSDFYLCDYSFVCEEDERTKQWNTVWVPALTLDEGRRLSSTEAPDDIRVIFKSHEIESAPQLEVASRADTIQGVIVNEIESLGGEERKILLDSYPRIDFDNVLILEHQRQPSSPGKVLAFLGIGVLMMSVGSGLFLLGRNRGQRTGGR